MWQVGKMDVNVCKAMAAEHTMSEDSEEEFVAPNTGQSTTPLQEWLFLVGIGGCVSAAGEIVEGVRPENEVLAKGRNAKSLEHLRGLVQAHESELTMAELVALRLYTGPMVWSLPTPLSCSGSQGLVDCFIRPSVVLSVLKVKVEWFSVLLHFLLERCLFG